MARCRWLEEDLESEVLSWFVVAHVHGILFFLNSVGQSNSEDVSLSMPGSTCQDVSVVNSSLDSVDGSKWSCLRSTSSPPQRASSTSSLWLNQGLCTSLGYAAFTEYEKMIGDAMRIQNTVFDVNFVALEEIWRGTSAGRPQQRAQDGCRCGHALAAVRRQRNVPSGFHG